MAGLVPDTNQPFVQCTVGTAGARRLLELADDPEVLAELVELLAGALDRARTDGTGDASAAGSSGAGAEARPAAQAG